MNIPSIVRTLRKKYFGLTPRRRLPIRRADLRLEQLESREVPAAAVPPSILSVSPADFSTQLTNPKITIQFSEKMDLGDVQNTSNYFLYNTQGKQVAIPSITYDNNNNIVTLDLTKGPALPVNTYTLFLKGDSIHEMSDTFTLAQPGQLVVANAGLSQSSFGPSHPTVSTINVANDGTLNTVSSYPLGPSTPVPSSQPTPPLLITVADFNGDGINDVAIVNTLDHTLNIYDGKGGTRGFDAKPTFSLALAANSNPVNLLAFSETTFFTTAVGPDLAITDQVNNQVIVFKNTTTANGRTAFGTGVPIAIPDPNTNVRAHPVGLAAGDIDSDGNLDLLVASTNPDANGTFLLYVLGGNGKGGFTAPAGKAIIPLDIDAAGKVIDKGGGVHTPSSLAVGPLDTDSRPDVVVVGNNGLEVLQNRTPINTPGAFLFVLGPEDLGLSHPYNNVAVGPVTNPANTIYDIVTTNNTNPNNAVLSVYKNSSGALTGPTNISLGQGAPSLTLAHLGSNGTGPVSAVIPFATTNSYTVLKNTNGNFGSPVHYQVDNGPVALAVGNGGTSNDSIDSSGDGVITGGGPNGGAIGGGDINGDGFPDVVTANTGSLDNGANLTGRSITVARGLGNGTFLDATTVTEPANAAPAAVVTGDVNGDGLIDYVTVDAGLDQVSVYLATAPGVYAPAVHYSITDAAGNGHNPVSVALADLTGTGVLDIVTADNADSFISILANDGKGNFNPNNVANPATTLAVGQGPTQVIAGVFNAANGKKAADLVVSHNGTGPDTKDRGVTVLINDNKGKRTFLAPVEYGADQHATAVAAGDFNDDGNLDFVFANGPLTGPGSLTLMRGDGAGNFKQFASPFPIAPNPSALLVTDVNRDGFPDVIVGSASTVNPNDGIGVLLNTVGSGFRPVIYSALPHGTPVNSLATTDLNENNPDAYPDLIVGTAPIDPAAPIPVVDNVFTLHNVGDGTFTNPLPYEAGGPPTPTSVATVSDPFVRVLTFFEGGTLVSPQVVNNGNFEARDLSNEQGNLVGWQTASLPDSHGGWDSQTATDAGSFSPRSGVQVLPPDNQFQAMLDEPDVVPVDINGNNPNDPTSYNGSHFLYQDVFIPANAASATLSLRLVLDNFAGTWATGQGNATLDYRPSAPNQQVRVDVVDPNAPIQDAGAGVLVNAFITNQGTPLVTDQFTGPIFVTADLTALKGRTVRVRIAAVNNLDKLVVGVDDVSVQVLYTDQTAPNVTGPQLRNRGYQAGSTGLPQTTDSTLVGQVSDDGGVNNVAFVAFDLSPNGVFNPDDPNVFKTNYFDSQGNFSVAVPGLPSGPVTLAVRVQDFAGNFKDTSISFVNLGPNFKVWQSAGPGPIDVTGESGISYTSVSGRITAVATDPTDPSGNSYYVGTANGGIWKTLDGGADWTPLTDFLVDQNGQPINVPVGGLAVSASNPQILYAATGVGDTFADSRGGVGVLKSTNGGLSWNVVGNSPAQLNGARVSKVAVDQGNPNTAYVAVVSGGAGPGVYRTIDGGLTWVNVLTPATMGLPAGTPLASVTDLVIDPHDASDVTIGLGNIGRVANSATAGVWQSSNANNAGGATWMRIVGGDNKLVQNNTLPSGLAVGRVSLTQGYGPRANIATVYVLIGNSTPANPVQGGAVNYGSALGLYKSSDGLQNFTKVMLKANFGGDVINPLNPFPPPPDFEDINLLGNDAGNAGSLVIDPTNPNVVYVGGADNSTRSNGLIRVDTGNMRDVNWFLKTLQNPGLSFPILGVVAPDPTNDGDDLTKLAAAHLRIPPAPATPVLKASGAYPVVDGGGAYKGEGVSWYDMELDLYSPAIVDAQRAIQYAPGSISSDVPLDPTPGVQPFAVANSSRLPAQIRTMTIDSVGRLIIGTEEGVYRALFHGTGYDYTSGGTGVVTDVSELSSPPAASVDFTSINGNLQISDLTSVAFDPQLRGQYYSSAFNTGTAMTTGGLGWTTMGLVGPFNAVDAGVVRSASPDVTEPPGTPITVFRSFAYYQSPAGLNPYNPQVSVQGGALGTWQTGTNAGISINDRAGYFPVLVVSPNKVFDPASNSFNDELLFGTDTVYTTFTSSFLWHRRTVGPLSKKGGVVTAAAIAPSNGHAFYVGDNLGEVFVDLNDGADGFPLRSAGSGMPSAPVTGITVDRNNPKVAYVTFGGTGNYSHLWVTNDGGLTWNRLDGDPNIGQILPRVPAYSVVTDPRPQAQAGAPFGHLYVGTEVGAYVSVDRGHTWQQLGHGLPHVPVVDMQFSQSQEQLVVATQGRGAFIFSTDHVGPRVVSVSPGSPASPGLSSVTVTFNEAIAAASFTPSQVVSITGPGGISIPQSAIQVQEIDVAPQGVPDPQTTFQISFPAQFTDGLYSFVIGPNITDVVGNAMDQNQNTVNGEPGITPAGDQFAFAVVINSTDDGRFVTGLYHDLLGRPADTNGFLATLGPIDAARFAQLPLIANAFASSTLARTQLIQDLYQSGSTPISTLGIGNLLGRPATQQEVNTWLTQLQQGLPTETMIDILVGSDAYFTQNSPGHVVNGDDTNFVNQAYVDLFQRLAGPNEVSLFANQLLGGDANARTQIATSLTNSAAFYTNFITNSYNLYLGRPPSQGEINSWLGAINGGKGQTEEQVIATLMGTIGPGSYFNRAPSILQASGNNNSYTANEAFVRAAYLQLLPGVPLNASPGQDPNVKHWVDLLNSHTLSTAQVAYTFLTSDLYRFDPSFGTVAQFYAAYLPGFTVTPDVINAWRPFFAKGGRTEDFQAILIGSSLYYTNSSKGNGTDTGWINAAWNDVFQVNTGAPAGQVTSIGNYLGAQKRVARQGVAQVLTSSPEFQNRLTTRVYNEYLHRNPSNQELAQWGQVLSLPSAGPNAPTRDEQLLAGLLGSPEYFLQQTDAAGLHTDAAWVNSLYPSLRIADSSGAPIILNNLVNAYQPQRLAAAQAFLHSAEYRTRIIVQNYSNFLGRNPTAFETGYWQTAFQQGATQEQMIATLMGNAAVADPKGKGDPLEYFRRTSLILGVTVSPNNQTFVQAAYKQLFPNYVPPQSEIDGWVQLLSSHQLNLLQVALALATSNRYYFDQANGLITQLYQRFIGRVASPPEIASWKNAYANGTRDEDVIAALLATSDYFFKGHPFP